jgi:hypothetical protein
VRGKQAEEVFLVETTQLDGTARAHGGVAAGGGVAQ